MKKIYNCKCCNKWYAQTWTRDNHERNCKELQEAINKSIQSRKHIIPS